MTALDPLTLPLKGVTLIEASAGTGKTFTIGVLYLRLLLGLGGKTAFSRPLSVGEILVVTFTEAATAELRGRIRTNIHEMRIACIRGHSEHPTLTALLEQLNDLHSAAAILLAAERQMDEAAIFTIHGFCQRMLNMNAFESGMLFEQQLLEDELPLRRQAAEDFWRRFCYPLPVDVARQVAALWSGPEQLLNTLSSWLSAESLTLRDPVDISQSLIEKHQQIIASIEQIKAAWLQAEDLLTIISTSGVDKRSYSSKHLPNWLTLISHWANSETTDYHCPKELERFAQSVLIDKTKKGEAPRHPIFSAIDLFLAESRSLRELVIAKALTEIRHSVAQEKQRKGYLGFDDLLSKFDRALQQPANVALVEAVRQRYPVAFIDEFQDTDPQQYRIFSTLYQQQPECGLLLIGDPKQAIYAFRGADIFTYMKARREVSAHYTLGVNWRSSVAMVESVNALFSRLDTPFLFHDIPFQPVRAAEKNRDLAFILHGEIQPAMTLWLQPGPGVTVHEYQQWMAAQSARNIASWLKAGEQQQALIGRGEQQRAVTAADITILVRSRHEALIMGEALTRLAIPSVYLSNRDSVFSTPEAQEVLWLLQAVLTPEQERTLRTALTTTILGMDALTLDRLNQDEQAWDALVTEFDHYRQRWLKRGVLPMLRELMVIRHIAENLLASPNGERRLTDFLHLGELLQEASVALDSEHALLRWLAQEIAHPDGQAVSQQLRLENDKHLVQIVTIHKAKGLEYPLVWLPFVANFRETTQAIYHDRQNFATFLDLHNHEESVALAKQERLAEDLRLLYVGVTRAVWHCSIGVAPVIRGNRKKEGVSDVHLSAIGYLLQQGVAAEAVQLEQQVCCMSESTPGIAVINHSSGVVEPWHPLQQHVEKPATRPLTRRFSDHWRITSYSGLQQQGHSSLFDSLPNIDHDAAGEQQQLRDTLLTAHTFPRGAAPGTFLHSLFEQLDFSQPVDNSWLEAQLSDNGFDTVWLPVFSDWINHILQAPLGENGLTLAQLTPSQKQVELQFYLPLQQMLYAPDLDALTKAYDPLSASCPPLSFPQVQGMLKGFIDLVFVWQGKYYLLDYKSNWLGDTAEHYTPQAMAQAMQSHRYELQYQLYTLALHRYLRHRIADYHYESHFGGIYYLFLRGIDGSAGEQGIFRTRLPYTFVEQLDVLFAGETEEKS
ncbi:MAG: RecBCD enzyme subunit RecB [Candidatus Erwinia impunctatus]|nr:RecBCD enzyme subunit RecB [Culicoides impunctatus]